MRLPYDYLRCMGIDRNQADKICERRETCARYCCKDDCGPRTPFTDYACGCSDEKTFEDHFIPK